MARGGLDHGPGGERSGALRPGHLPRRLPVLCPGLDLPLLAAIEEEEGSEASAKEINEITALVKEYNLPVIFTEVNGSDATAQAIARETGCAVAQLTMLMDGPDGGTLSDDYCDGLMENIRAIVNGFAGEEVLA